MLAQFTRPGNDTEFAPYLREAYRSLAGLYAGETFTRRLGEAYSALCTGTIRYARGYGAVRIDPGALLYEVAHGVCQCHDPMALLDSNGKVLCVHRLVCALFSLACDAGGEPAPDAGMQADMEQVLERPGEGIAWLYPVKLSWLRGKGGQG